MPSPEEIAAAKKVLGLKASPTSRSEDVVAAKKDFIKTKIKAAQTALSSSNPEDQIEAASEAGEESAHPEDCKCTDCVHHPKDCMCGCQDHEEDAESAHNWKECDCEKCKRARYIADHISDREEHPEDMRESTQITNFIKALSQKNYSVANKYLQGVVDAKLKRSISNALNK